MSDLHHDDDVLSAWLDGEATADEAAAVEAGMADDPAVAARVEQLRAVAAAVATPVVPAPAGARERAVAAALAAAGAVATDRADGAAPGPPADLAARRRRRSTIVLSAAAAVVAVLLAVPVVRSWTGDDTGDREVAGPAASQEATADEDGGDTAAAGRGVPEALPELGALDSPEDVAAAVGRTTQPSTQAGMEAATEEDDGAAAAPAHRCEPGVRAADPGLGALVLSATATYQGTEAYVLGFVPADAGTGTGVLQVLVLDVRGCAPLADPVQVP